MLLKKGYQDEGKLYSALSVIYLIKQDYDHHYSYVEKVVKNQLEKYNDILDINVLCYLSEHYMFK